MWAANEVGRIELHARAPVVVSNVAGDVCESASTASPMMVNSRSTDDLTSRLAS